MVNKENVVNQENDDSQIGANVETHVDTNVDSNIALDIPVFGEQSVGAREEPPQNEELNQFVQDTQQEEKTISQQVTDTANDKIEQLTETVANKMIIDGVGGVISVVSMMCKSKIEVSATEIECLADDLSPAVVKFANDIGEVPPWLKEVLKYRVELIALKGILLFGVSIYLQVKEQKRQAALEEKRYQAELALNNKSASDGH